MKGFDRWLETNPYETSDEHIEAVVEALGMEFYLDNREFVESDKFSEIADKACCKEYFVSIDKTAKLIERLFYLYKL
jgi:hypothetical protein